MQCGILSHYGVLGDVAFQNVHSVIDHFCAGTLGVKLRGSGRGCGVAGRILQDLPADDAAVSFPE